MNSSILSPAAIARGDLSQLPLKNLAKEGWTRAQILLGQIGNEKFIVKDFASKSFFTRWCIGWPSIRKEWRVYKRLEGLEGIPKAFQKLDASALLMEYVEGFPIKRALKERLDWSFFQQLERLVDRIHSKGIAHLDLGQKRNILIDDQNRPHLVDFSSAFTLGNLPLLRSTLFPLLKWIDKRGIYKFKERYAPQLLTPFEEKILKRFRFLKRFWIFKILKGL